MNNENNNENLIELLKQALLFYGNSDNYNKVSNNNDKLFSYIEMDGGNQARFALKLIHELEIKNKSNEELYETYVELMKNDIDINNNIEKNFENIIFNLKDINENF